MYENAYSWDIYFPISQTDTSEIILIPSKKIIYDEKNMRKLTILYHGFDI